jgi:hypothetical protein
MPSVTRGLLELSAIGRCGIGTAYDYESHCCRIRRWQTWKLCLLSAACAEKVFPIVHALGLKRTCLLVEECQNFIWSSPFSTATNSDEAQRLLEALRSTPEWDCDGDNSYLPFEVARALDRLHLSLTTITSPEPHTVLEALISLMRDLADSWDATLSRGKGLRGSAAQPILLEDAEVASQERLINMIEAAHEASTEAIALVKAEAQSVRALFRQYAPMYCFECLSSGLERSSLG